MHPSGTITRRVMAWWQWMLMGVFFVGPVLLYTLFMAEYGQDLQSQNAPGWIFMGMMSVGVGLGIWIGRKPKGEERTWITGAAGVRGEFVLRRPILLSMLPFCTMVSVISIVLLEEEPYITERHVGGVIIVLFLFAVVPLIWFLSGVWGFRVDEAGSLWYRTSLRWYPFEITDYRVIRNGVTRGRYGSLEIPYAVIFKKPMPGKRGFRLHLAWVHSKTYKTTVPVTAIDDYFRQRCVKAGYSLKKKPDSIRWDAERKV